MAAEWIKKVKVSASQSCQTRSKTYRGISAVREETASLKGSSKPQRSCAERIPFLPKKRIKLLVSTVMDAPALHYIKTLHDITLD